MLIKREELSMDERNLIEVLDEGFEVLCPTSEDASLSVMPTNTNCAGC
jgi:hypothetical protein